MLDMDLLPDDESRWGPRATPNNHITLMPNRCGELHLLRQLPTKSSLIFVELKRQLAAEKIQCECWQTDTLARFLQELGFLCPRLVYLRVHDDAFCLTEDEMRAIADNFPQLRHLDVVPKEGRYGEAYREVARRCENIVMSLFTPREGLFDWMANNCTNLKQLHLNLFADNYKFAWPSRELKRLLQARADHFVELTLNFHRVNGQLIDAIAHCKSLRALCLCYCELEDGATLVTLAALRKLSTLRLLRLEGVHEQDLNNFIVAADMSVLTDLNISRMPFSDLSAFHLSTKESRVRRLKLMCCHLTPNGVLHLSNMTSLQLLDLLMELPDNVIDKICDDSKIQYLGLEFSDTNTYIKYKDKIKIYQSNFFHVHPLSCCIHLMVSYYNW